MPDAPFDILRDERERLEGIAPGTDRAHLRRLRRGEVSVDVEIDLHGLDRQAARRELRETLERAIADENRCVAVIHGRGTFSPGGQSVLRDHLVSWLSEVPHASRILAFASGLRERGGATYVLLRRRRT